MIQSSVKAGAALANHNQSQVKPRLVTKSA